MKYLKKYENIDNIFDDWDDEEVDDSWIIVEYKNGGYYLVKEIPEDNNCILYEDYEYNSFYNFNRVKELKDDMMISIRPLQPKEFPTEYKINSEWFKVPYSYLKNIIDITI